MRHLLCLLVLFALLVGTPDATFAKGKAPQAHPVFDAAKRKRTRHQISEYFSASAYLNLSYLAEVNRRRDDGVRDSMDEFAALIGLFGRVQLTHNITFFAHAEGTLKGQRTDVTARSRITDPQLKEMLLAFAVNEAVTVTLGRMRFSDRHRWSADASVDGVHVAFKNGARVLEFALFEGTRTNTSRFAMVHYGAADPVQTYGLLALAEENGPEQRLHLHGYYARTVSERFRYQANVGAVFGDAQNGKSAGFGFDLRAERKFGNSALNPQLTFGFAYGSEGFAQSGLHTNKTYDGGQFQFNRYGYAYQPELTNLAIAQIGVGIRPSRKFSADLIVSAYAQPSPSTTGPNARLDGATTGSGRFLGHEIALVGAYRPKKNTKIEFGVGRFKPGSAYVDRSSATRVFARISIQF